MSNSQVTTLDDEPKAAKEVKSEAKPSAKAEKSDGQKFFNVVVHPGQDALGELAAEITVNGTLYQLPRGVSCKVPYAVLHVLENAVITSYKMDGLDYVEKSTPRFAFSATPA